MIVGSLELSGLGMRVSRFLLDLSGGELIIALPLIGIAAFILGMGMDALPAYITLAVLVAPALIHLGVPDLAAHLFVFYWTMASFFTPPVCLAVYVACGMSGASIWQTGWQAIRLAPVIYLLPFIFAVEPAFLLQDTLLKNLMAAITAIVGAVSIASGIRGYGVKVMNWPQRIMCLAGGLALLWPTLVLSLSGITAVALSVVWQKLELPSAQKSNVK